MSRFYINDGNRPGRRTPVVDYATSASGLGSEVMNEAQAIARGRKLTATLPSTPPVLLAPTAFGTSGNYNGSYDINGVDPASGHYVVALLNDGSVASEPNQWLSARNGGSTPHWAGFDLGVQRQLSSYRIRNFASYANNGVVPKRWRFEGSNVTGWGGPWTVLDDKTGSDHIWTSPWEYTAVVSGAYRYVRVYIPAQPHGFDTMALGELEVYGN